MRHFEEIERDPMILQRRMGLLVSANDFSLVVRPHWTLIFNAVILFFVGVLMSFGLGKAYFAENASMVSLVLYLVVGFTGLVSMVIAMERFVKWINFKLEIQKNKMVKTVLHDLKRDELEIYLSNPTFDIHHHDHQFHLRLNQGDDQITLVSVKDAIFHSEHGLSAVKNDIEKFLAD